MTTCPIKEKAYRRSPRGFLGRRYDEMRRRVNGLNKAKAYLYEGLDIVSRNDFLEWALADKEFSYLYVIWIMNNYELKYTPTVDRINSSRGYTFDNMEWVDYSENSRRGAINRTVKPTVVIPLFKRGH